jgi:hypothetical protein
MDLVIKIVILTAPINRASHNFIMLTHARKFQKLEFKKWILVVPSISWDQFCI